MNIAILLYDGFTALDAIGPYEVLSRLPGASVTFVASEPGIKWADTRMLGLSADCALAQLPAPEIVLVPGGPGRATAAVDERALDWLRGAHATSVWTVSVCTGSLVLGAAGLLEGVRATTHWGTMDELAAYGAKPVAERVVFDGKIVTGAGVSAGIDLGLTLIARIAGDAVAQTVQLAIEYDPQPPFAAGSPRTAPPAILELARANRRRRAIDLS